MKKSIIAALLAVVFALPCNAGINTVTGVGEGTGWETFSAQLQRSSTARARFLAGLMGSQTDPADSGAIRLQNAELIAWEASPAGTDVTLTVNSSEQFVFSASILSPTLVTPVLGVATGTSLAATGAITSSGAAGIGYATGAGGTVTQDTSRTTTVVLNKTTGQITTTADSMAALTPTTFTITNSAVAATDVIVCSKVSGDADTVVTVNSVAAGSFTVTLYNRHATDADVTAFVFNFAVIKGATS